ncbi:UDP-N-acetylmuramoyl-tripeptide--D-alanyl-D-alanine ligase [Gracilimonas mengyeensis]|uniref:UDP-N-acetylmuramoyl-tripeptide--D-alanyl-D-alanine ligase n=1 Tax=Gracilimonas mengyeensis TaxID=1302730 RepID=A0A521CW65_9BACT|nr:UDP-N-acetylmuramoyl-tripeptide--D-alanyl-D-alanine ligase [Gracilimonas mengyeensis]SMO63673.1 UDP-N-acetylmuramoyl-tripeptide--D-alanyl-D-alanine ligase [Gracilimonas mengyeensis]
MNWYYLFIDIGAILFSLVFARYTWYRMRFFLHNYQQVGYKNNEFWQWMKSHWDAYIIPPDIAILNILIFVFLWFDGWLMATFTYSSLSVFFLGLSIAWFASVKRYRPEKVKKPLVYTARVKRFLVPYVLLSVFFPALFLYMSYTGFIPYYQLPLPNYFVGFQSFDLVMLVFGWAFGTMIIPFYVLLSGLITKPVEKYIQNGFKKQARKKLASMPDLKVVAITGSYGKTSTKFMIRDLLKERYNVCSTPGSYNTPMGICKVINNDLQSNHQILILEMGARYEGNIQELCDIAKPDISVVTNVGVAHLETFGSQDVIAREKGTLVRNLEAGDVAVLNADDPRVSQMGAKRKEITRIMAGLKSGEIQGSNITYDTSGMEFEVSIGDEKEQFKTRLLGAHNVQNLLLAVGVAHHFGIRLKTMALAASRIEPVEHRLELKQQGDLVVIDDAFNSNPVGAKNAVEILAQFNSGQRIIITPGMIELGEIEAEENKKFGAAIGRANLDLVILVGEERAQPILEGIREEDGAAMNVRVVNSLYEANDLVKKHARAGDVVLYENDLPDVYNE